MTKLTKEVFNVSLAEELVATVELGYTSFKKLHRGISDQREAAREYASQNLCDGLTATCPDGDNTTRRSPS